jgi:hypothetical protein
LRVYQVLAIRFFSGLEINLIKIYKAIIKTGLNLAARFYGDQALASAEFCTAMRVGGGGGGGGL